MTPAAPFRFMRLGVQPLLLAGVALLLAACAPATQAPAQTGDTNVPTGPTGKAVVALTTQTTATVDPAKEGGVSDFVNMEALFNRLAETPKDSLELGPGLASRWTMSADGLQYEFQIRKGVRFHNGDELTPDDVLYSVQRVSRVARPETKAYAETTLQDASVSGDTVVFRLKHPDWTFLSQISGTAYSVIPRKYAEQVGENGFAKAPVGTGPFKFAEYAKQEFLEVEAVDYEHFLWQPGVKRLRYVVVPEETTRMAMVRTGEADLAQVSVSSLKTIESDSKLKPIRVPNVGGLRLFMFGQHDPQNPLSKPEVRRALSLAIDRQAIADGVYRGYARPTAVSLWNPTREGWPSWGFDAPKQDMEQAKQLLAKAGYADGKGLKLTFHNFEYGALPLFTQAAQVIKEQWGKLGVTVELRQWEWGAYAPAARADKFEPVAVSTHLANTALDIGFVNDFLPGSNYQYASGVGRGAHPEGTKLADQWVQELDPRRRVERLQKVFEYDRDNVVDIPVVAMDALWVGGPKLQEYTPRPGTFTSGNVWTIRVKP